MVTQEAKIEQYQSRAVEHDSEFEAVQGDFQIESVGIHSLPLEPNIKLGFLRDGRLRIREVIDVTVTQEEDGQIAAEAEGLNEFGYGDNPTDAITDLQHVISELYFTLEEDHERLGKDLKSVWETLQVKIEKR